MVGEGAQRPLDVRENPKPPRRGDVENSSSSNSERTQTQLNANEVITGSGLARTLGVKDFGRNTHFRLKFGSNTAECTEEDQGEMNFTYWPEVHFTQGLR